MASVIKVDTIKSTTGNTALTISESGITTFNKSIVNYVPIFTAYFNSNITAPTSNTDKEIVYNVLSFDIDNENNGNAGWYSTSTGRYTPQLAGYYSFSATTGVDFGARSWQRMHVAKNGSLNNQALSNFNNQSAGLNSMNSSVVYYMNGTTDYVSVFVGINYSSTPVIVPTSNVFSGFLVRAA